MSTYEELQIILATALLIVAILIYTYKKIAVLFFVICSLLGRQVK